MCGSSVRVLHADSGSLHKYISKRNSDNHRHGQGLPHRPPESCFSPATPVAHRSSRILFMLMVVVVSLAPATCRLCQSSFSWQSESGEQAPRRRGEEFTSPKLAHDFSSTIDSSLTRAVGLVDGRCKRQFAGCGNVPVPQRRKLNPRCGTPGLKSVSIDYPNSEHEAVSLDVERRASPCGTAPGSVGFSAKIRNDYPGQHRTTLCCCSSILPRF